MFRKCKRQKTVKKLVQQIKVKSAYEKKNSLKKTKEEVVLLQKNIKDVEPTSE
jgi:hypothetical protein